MIDYTFKRKLLAGEPLIGTLLTLGCAEIGEILSQAGFDWLWIDMEHSALTLPLVQHILQAKSSHCPALVRVPEISTAYFKSVLDMGADGVIVPMVNSAEDARRVISGCKYPPDGHRGAGGYRAQAYGAHFQEYITSANDNITILLQIESRDGADNIAEILNVPDVDGIIIGPYDLSGSVGRLGEITHPEVIRYIEKIQSACRKRNKPLGIFCPDAGLAKEYLTAGFQLIALGMDVSFLRAAAKGALDQVGKPLLV